MFAVGHQAVMACTASSPGAAGAAVSLLLLLLKKKKMVVLAANGIDVEVKWKGLVAFRLVSCVGLTIEDIGAVRQASVWGADCCVGCVGLIVNGLVVSSVGFEDLSDKRWVLVGTTIGVYTRSRREEERQDSSILHAFRHEYMRTQNLAAFSM
jgi:hypothetical protein